jgi:hypothetical protein
MKKIQISIALVLFSICVFAQKVQVPSNVKAYIEQHPSRSIGYQPATGEIIAYDSYSASRNSSDILRLEFRNSEIIGHVPPLNSTIPCGGWPFFFSADCTPGLLNNVSGSAGGHVVECLSQPGICFMTNVSFNFWMW